MNGEKSLRIAELEQLITRYQKSYYDGVPEVSDADFDALWDELKNLDAENPLLKKIGADSLAFISIEGMISALQGLCPASDGYCTGCFTGKYPMPAPGELSGKRI